MARKLNSVTEDDGMFDLEFWERIGEAGLLVAAWDMIKEYDRVHGRTRRQPRLQRHVCRVVRR